jgi:hypothetical protein
MKGEVRSPITTWLFALVSCGIYGWYWWYLTGNELKNYLGKEDLNPTIDAILAALIPPYMCLLAWRYGPLIQEAQERAGVSDAEDKGMNYVLFTLLCFMGFKNMQEDLNKVWEAGGGAPATF